MDAQLITIGDELLLGQTTNTNAAWLGEQLGLMGVEVQRTVVVRDADADIRTELERAFGQRRLVIVTGGLGPTHDDRTREVLAAYFDAPLRTHDDLLDRLRRYYERRERSMPSSAASLAAIPEGFEVLDNPVGAAVGLWYEGERGLLAALPGIPEEMKGIFRAAVRPRLEAQSDLRNVTHRTLVTAGLGETALQEKLADLSEGLDEQPHLAYLPSTSGVRLRLTAVEGKKEAASARLDRLEALIRKRAGAYVIGTGDDTLEGVLAAGLKAQGLSIATAESATGGLIGHRLTSISGSSEYFVGGIIAYANQVKRALLGVDGETLRTHGAVSERVACQMAQGVRDALGADVGVATTGIAGPTGGHPEKPVGTVWLGYADEAGTRAVRRQFVEDRALNKKLFASGALDLVRREIQD